MNEPESRTVSTTFAPFAVAFKSLLSTSEGTIKPPFCADLPNFFSAAAEHSISKAASLLKAALLGSDLNLIALIKE